MAYHWDKRLTPDHIAAIGEGIIRAGNHARAQAKVDGLSDTHIKLAVKKAEKAKREEMVKHFLGGDDEPAVKKPRPNDPPVIINKPLPGSDEHKAQQAAYKAQLARGLKADDVVQCIKKDNVSWAVQRDGKIRRWKEGDVLAEE